MSIPSELGFHVDTNPISGLATEVDGAPFDCPVDVIPDDPRIQWPLPGCELVGRLLQSSLADPGAKTNPGCCFLRGNIGDRHRPGRQGSVIP